MNAFSPLHGDLYALTMGQALWKSGRWDRQASFNLFFRKHPFKGGYAVAAGIDVVMERLSRYRFTESCIQTLAQQSDMRGDRLFHHDYLDFLMQWRFQADVLAVEEGTIVFAHEPLMNVTGRIFDGMILETMALQEVNFETLIATKAHRCVQAARRFGQANVHRSGRHPASVLEFGYRRAQNPMTATRACWIGGVAATSNMEAARMYALPMKGTHAHLFVMAYEHQDEAFRAYVDGMPGNATLLVDTYNTLDGVRDAIAVGLEMRARGQHLHGIRLDSGDLAWLSQRARAMLNDAGFVNTKIIASNDLDEHLIESLGHQGAEIDIFGVGTNLVTASDQPALGGVYKLGAMDLDGSGVMKDRIKASEDLIKTSIPGAQNVRRYTMDGRMVCDAIYDRQVGISDTACVIVDPMDPTKTRHPGVGSVGDDLLIPMMLHGRLTRRVNPYDLDAARKRCEAQTALLDPTIQRLQNPHSYPVGIEERLAQRRLALVQEIRRANHSA